MTLIRVTEIIAYLGGMAFAGFVVGCVIGMACCWIADLWTRPHIKNGDHNQ